MGAREALMKYEQADQDGVVVLASRQAIHEVAEQYDEMREALRCALAQLEADHDADAAAEMFGGEPDPARAMTINRHDVAEMIRVALSEGP